MSTFQALPEPPTTTSRLTNTSAASHVQATSESDTFLSHNGPLPDSSNRSRHRDDQYARHSTEDERKGDCDVQLLPRNDVTPTRRHEDAGDRDDDFNILDLVENKLTKKRPSLVDELNQGSQHRDDEQWYKKHLQIVDDCIHLILRQWTTDTPW